MGIKTVFELVDKFSSPLRRISQTAERSSASLSKAGQAADRFSDEASKVSESARKASEETRKLGEEASKTKTQIDKSGKGDPHKETRESTKKTRTETEKLIDRLKKLATVSAAIGGAKKLAAISDEFSNANARLGLINTDKSGKTIDPALQTKVYASSQRSRAGYSGTANAVSSFMLNAGKNFKGADEAIAFTEAINKQMVIAGASSQTAENAMVQLTQAMGAGALRGEELNSVLDAAPSIARNIEKYMGIAEGSIKQYAEKGVITAEVVKNAQLAAADEINGKFQQMPMTWGQVGTQMSNALLWGLQPVLGIVSGIANNLDIIGPIALGVAGAVGVFALATQGAAIAQWALNSAQAVFNALAAMNPIGLAAMVILVLIGALYGGVAAWNKFTGASVSATGILVGSFRAIMAALYNIFVHPFIWAFVEVSNFLGNVLNNPIAAIKILFLDMASYCIDQVLNMAKAIENIINKIPGVKVNFTAGLEGLKGGLESKIKTIKDESGWKEFVKAPELADISKEFSKGYEKGKDFESGIKNFFAGGGGGLPDGLGGVDKFSGNLDPEKPKKVKGGGKNGSLNVSLEDEDIDYLRQLAERDYVARISQNTLAPNISVNFTGDIRETADVDAVAARISGILRDEIDAAPEGLY